MPQPVALTRNMLTQMLQSRPAAPAPSPTDVPRGGQGLSVAQLKRIIDNMVDAEPWIYYDTRILSANIVGSDSAAFNFAQITSPLPFFNTRNIGNAKIEITSMSDSQKTDADFVCTRITIDVWCDTDAPAAAGIATGPAFVETVVNYGILQIAFGTNTKLLIPVVKCPAGGGVVQNVKVRTQTAAANSDSGAANNGLQTSDAARDLATPIFFKEGTAFTCNLAFPANTTGSAGALHRLQGLQALTGDFEAGIRINLEGVRGRALLPGSR